MAENQLQHGIPLHRSAQTDHLKRRPALFHHDRNCIHIRCTGCQQLLLCKTKRFSGHVIEITNQLQNFLRLLRRFTEKSTHTIETRKNFMSEAVPCFFGLHRRHGTETISKITQKRRTRRRTQLALNLPAVHRDSAQQPRSRGRRNRQNAVRTVNMTASGMNRRSKNLLRSQHFHQQTNTDNISDRILCPDLMKMDLSNRTAVCLTLCLCNQLIHRQCIAADTLRHLQGRDQRCNLIHRRMMMCMMMMLPAVMMRMHFIGFLRTVNQNVHFRAADALHCGSLRTNGHICKP